MEERKYMGKRHGLTNKNTEQDNNNNYRNGSKETGIYRNHKDGVAYKLFSGKKESLSLYNSIMRTDYTDPDEIEVVTLNSAIYIGRKNDNAIILHFNMLLTEFQTTFNPNMPLRTLIYVSNEYEKYIAEHELNLYSEYIQKIPTPYFVTLYYGSKEQPEKQILRLSDAYKNKTENPVALPCKCIYNFTDPIQDKHDTEINRQRKIGFNRISEYPYTAKNRKNTDN